MIQSLAVAGLVGAGSYLLLSLIVAVWHRLSGNRDRTYRWGILTFSILAAIYAWSANLGR